MQQDAEKTPEPIPANPTDPELDAIQVVVRALEPLKEDARARVVDYVFRRLGISSPAARPSTQHTAETIPASHRTQTPEHSAGGQKDIRTFTLEKSPRSAREMTVVVAYYLAELAPQAERKNEINAADLQRYFRLANFRLPSEAGMTLSHTKNAGYLDQTGRGKYRLNPVGYNLVAHALPSGTDAPERMAPRGSKIKRSTKSSRKSR